MNDHLSQSHPPRATWPRGARWFCSAALLLLTGSAVFGQANLPGMAGGRGGITRFHPAPNFRQVDMKLTGDSVTNINKQIRAMNTEFWAYETNGTPLVTLRTPVCFLDETEAKARTLSSPEQLTARSGDGKFQIQGRGFLWRHNQKLLIISNEVRALIHWTNNAPPLEITSRWFELDAERGLGIFHDDVHGEDAERIFTCETLTVSGSVDKLKRSGVTTGPTNRAPFDLIEADGGLVITGKFRPGHAKAQRGSFRQTEQRIDLIGDAEWSFDGYSGSADRMTAWLVNTNIDASGKVKLTLPRSALGAAGGLLNITNAPTKSTSTDPVTIAADRFTRRGEQLLVEGAVRIADGTNYLTCDRIDGKYTPQSPGSETAIATGNVFVGSDSGGIYSDRADYSKVHDQVLFTGNPRFKLGQANGTAGRVIARPATRELLADNGVVATLTFASDRDTFLNVLPDTKTNRVERTGPTNQTVQITAQTFSLRDRLALFTGDVEAHQLPRNGSEPRMRSAELEVRLAANKRTAESVQARQDVVCERGTIGVTNGPTDSIYTRMDADTLTARIDPATEELVDLVAGGGVRLKRSELTARGDKAVYTRADQLLKLLGQSVIDSPEAIYTSSQGLTWHIATEQVVGSYDSIRFKPAALKRAEELPTLQPNE